jgi:hypothetical protein
MILLERATVAPVIRWWFHHPTYPGESQPLEARPYLSLPFRKSDLARVQIRASQPGIGRKLDYHVSEGWMYSSDVTKIVPYKHGGVDYELPFGFPVAAPCDGYAISSYHSNRQPDGQGFGIGNFVQIYNPEVNRFVQMGHLADIHASIPFSLPKRAGKNWLATGHLQTPEELMRAGNRSVKFVRRGEIIGSVGFSGLTREEDYREGSPRPCRVDPKNAHTWSTPHIHFDESQRNRKTLDKDWRRDPYDIYLWRNAYPTHKRPQAMGPEPLFITDDRGLPKYADA